MDNVFVHLTVHITAVSHSPTVKVTVPSKLTIDQVKTEVLRVANMLPLPEGVQTGDYSFMIGQNYLDVEFQKLSDVSELQRFFVGLPSPSQRTSDDLISVELNLASTPKKVRKNSYRSFLPGSKSKDSEKEEKSQTLAKNLLSAFTLPLKASRNTSPLILSSPRDTPLAVPPPSPHINYIDVQKEAEKLSAENKKLAQERDEERAKATKAEKELLQFKKDCEKLVDSEEKASAKVAELEQSTRALQQELAKAQQQNQELSKQLEELKSSQNSKTPEVNKKNNNSTGEDEIEIQKKLEGEVAEKELLLEGVLNLKECIEDELTVYEEGLRDPTKRFKFVEGRVAVEKVWLAINALFMGDFSNNKKDDRKRMFVVPDEPKEVEEEEVEEEEEEGEKSGSAEQNATESKSEATQAEEANTNGVKHEATAAAEAPTTNANPIHTPSPTATSPPPNAQQQSADIWEIDFGEISSKFQKKVGEGAFAEVYLAKWQDKEVAVKKIKAISENEVNESDFQKEIKLLCSLSHPNIVKFLGACSKAPNLCIIMEFLSKGSLSNLLYDKKNVKFDWPLRLKIAFDVAKGMEYLHTRTPKIIHRDLKADNVFVDSNWNAKLGDFGLAKIKTDTIRKEVSRKNLKQMLKEHRKPLPQAIKSNKTLQHVESFVLGDDGGCGTPAWCAPELIGYQPYNEYADVYSYGIFLWELLTRERPHGSRSDYSITMGVMTMMERPDIPADCPPAYAQLIQACWADKVSHRPNFPIIIEVLYGFMDSLVQAKLQSVSPTVSPGSSATSSPTPSSSNISSSPLPASELEESLLTSGFAIKIPLAVSASPDLLRKKPTLKKRAVASHQNVERKNLYQ